MRGAKEIAHVFVGARPRVLIADEQRNRAAERPALEDAGEDLDPVCFLARRREHALTGAPAVEIGLDLGHVEGKPRRTALHHDADAPAMGFAEGRDAEGLAEDAAHGSKELRLRVAAEGIACEAGMASAGGARCRAGGGSGEVPGVTPGLSPASPVNLVPITVQRCRRTKALPPPRRHFSRGRLLENGSER